MIETDSMPNNTNAEQMTLGVILLDNGVAPQALYELSPDDYYLPRHRYVFEAMRSLDRKTRGIDPLTLQEELQLAGRASECDPAFIASLFDGVPRFSNITEYVRQIKEASIKRQAIYLADWLAKTAEATDVTADELLTRLTAKVEALQQSKIVDDLISSESAVDRTLTSLNERWNSGREIIGLPTGLTDLDDLLNGIRPGKVYCIAASTGLGKTTLALNWADNFVSSAPESEMPVGLIISLEMGVEELTVKLLSVRTRIDSARIESGHLSESERKSVRRAAGNLASLPIEYVEGFSPVTASSITSRVEKIRRKHGRLDFLIVDYLQLLDASEQHENEHARLTEISRTLKRIAQRHQIPVIALSQLNRQWANRQQKDPELSDLRGSGSIEQDSDVVIFIAPEDFSDPENPGRRLLIRKHRGGRKGVSHVVFFGSQSQFASAARPATSSHSELVENAK